MKRALSIILALVMVLSLSITAFAAEVGANPSDGSVTITNATVGQTYKLYEIFDATHDNVDGTTAVAYTITTDNQFFPYLFGEDGTTENQYLVYTPGTHSVVKRGTADNTKLIDYLGTMVKDGNYTATAEQVASSAEVVFSNLPYGYYMIIRDGHSAVTIDSNTPDVKVIDKNQAPGGVLDKTVKLPAVENYSDGVSANIGDKVNYKITFDTTNYYGPQKIKYYQVNDTKGDAIWVDYNSFQVAVGGQTLNKGYFLNQTTETIGGYEVLGDWGTETPDMDKAQWYLVYLGDNQFRITIPWLKNHNIAGDPGTYTLAVSETEDSLYASPSDVVITYDAYIETNATIGTASSATNQFNRARATWVTENESHYSNLDEVNVDVYGIGVLKDDGATLKNLAGAVFRLYSDEACKNPVYVIPTDVEGIYMVDSMNRDVANNKSPDNDTLQTARKVYANKLDAYLNGKDQDNYMITPVNGKIAVLGLADATYYLEEVEAPDGYNKLHTVLPIEVTDKQELFSIFADSTGKVYDVQDGYIAHSYTVYRTTVHNSKGVELPSTGGEGAALLITIGAVLACAFAVLLITQKKMSIYKD